MESVGDEHTGQRTPMKKVAGASFAGAFLEWYDFNLFGIASALVFNQLFFPNFAPLAGTLAAFAGFAAGFLMRPIGAVIFGHFGDRVGRKSVLVATMLLIGGTTFLIGLLPTYAAIGIWAPVLLVALRLVQGLGLGGEFGGAALMTVEHAPRNKRGFWGSIPQLGPTAGFLFGTSIVGLFTFLLSDEQFLSWGWRVPFLLSAILLAVGLFIRLKILETPAFRQVKESGTEAQIPIWDLLRTYPKTTALTFGARLAEPGSAKLYLVFALTYVTTQVGLSRDVALAGVIVTNVIALILIPIIGALSDRVGRRPLYMVGAILMALYAFPYFWLLNTGALALVLLALSLSWIAGAIMASLQSTFFTELLGTRVRYSGLSVAYQLSATATGFFPAIFALLLATTGAWWPLAAIIVAIALISLVCTYLLAETFRNDVSEQQREAEPVPETSLH